MMKKASSSPSEWVKTSKVFRIKGNDGSLYEISRGDFRKQLLVLKENSKKNHWELPRTEMIIMKQILEILFAFKDYSEIYTPLVKDINRVFGKIEHPPKDSVAGFFISCVLKDQKSLNTTDECNISSSIAIYFQGKLLLHKINYSHIYIHVDKHFNFFDLETLMLLEKNGIKEVTIINEDNKIIRQIPLDKLDTQIILPSVEENKNQNVEQQNTYLWFGLGIILLLIILIVIYRNRQSLRLK